MIRFDVIIAALVSALVVWPTGFLVGRWAGISAVESAYREKARALGLRLADFEKRAALDAAAIQALEGEAVRLGQELEAEAYGDDDALLPALGVDGVRRVFSR